MELLIGLVFVLVVALPIVFFVRWASVSSRFRAIQRRLDELESRPGETAAALRAIEERVGRLEALFTERRPPPVPAEPTAAAPERARPAPVAPAPRAPVPEPAAAAAPRLPMQPVPPRPYRPIVRPSEPARPPAVAAWTQRLREHLAGEEWEVVIGGNWLNKLGVLVLVIGLSLFLGYSLAHLGPAGRVAVGLLVSGAMLAGGVALERRARYVIFARGLVGGGWAALYFTTYATHGLEAARVVEDPRLGFGLLAAVAAGMILHSLRYQSETVTGVAFGVGFVTLTISPATGFSLLASVPLAGSLLWVARRFGWDAIAVAGVILTYGAYAVRHAVPAVTDLSSAAGAGLGRHQAVLAVYWLLFETFDLLAAAGRRGGAGARMLFPLNACGFVGVSLLEWSALQPGTAYRFFAGAALAYLTSAIIRGRLRPPASFPAGADALTRALSGGYEGAVTLAVLLVTPGLFLRFSGVTLNVALLLEAEFLFLAGLTLGQPYLRGLAAAVFVLPVVRLIPEVARGGHVAIGAARLMAWTPVALLTAGVAYLNRALAWSGGPAPLTVVERGYGYAASALLALVLAYEVPRDWLGVAWFLLALPLFELGLRRDLPEFRLQAYGVGALAVATMSGVSVLGLGRPTPHPWASLGPAALLAYAATARLFRLAPDRVAAWERAGVRDASAAAGTALLAALVWHVLPTPLVALGWGVLGLALVEVGLAVPLPSLRVCGHLVAALTFGRLVLANFTGTGATAGVSHRILTVVPLIALFACVAGRLGGAAAGGRLGPREQGLRRLYVYAPGILAALLLRFELGRVLTVVGWAILGLALLIAGIRWESRDLRWQSYALALLTFARSWATNFYIPESLAGAAGRVTTGALVATSFYTAQFLIPRSREDAGAGGSNPLGRALAWCDRHGRAGFSLLATALLALLLLYEVSGRLLTVAWGLQGVLLAVVGFPTRERVLRLSGLVLFGVCVLKLFFYDLRELDALARILSFVVLGLVLLGVSLVYTRFREQLRRYL